MQTLYKDEAITIAPNLDGYLLSDFQHTLGDLSDGFWLERCATLYRYVDVRDREFFSPHHGTFPRGMLGSALPKEITLSLRDVSVLPEVLEPIRCHFGVSNRVHDVFMAHVVVGEPACHAHRWRACTQLSAEACEDELGMTALRPLQFGRSFSGIR